MILQQVVLIVFLLLFIGIVLSTGKKSNRAVAKRQAETWAIIGREFIEFTEEEMEWRSQYVK